MNEKYAELLGLMAGDGCLSRSGGYMIYIAGHKIDDLDYHQNVTKVLFKIIFEKDVKIGFRKDQLCLFIRFSDKKIFEELAKYLPIGFKYEKLKIPSEVLVQKEYFFAFVRGVVDTDGCVVFSKQHKTYRYYPRIEITSKSKEFLLSISLELKKYGFYTSVSHKGNMAYRLEIPGYKNLKRWMESIGFSNQKHLEKIKGLLPDPLRLRAGSNR